MIIRNRVQVSGRAALARFDVFHQTTGQPLVTLNHVDLMEPLAIIGETGKKSQAGVGPAEKLRANRPVWRNREIWLIQ